MRLTFPEGSQSYTLLPLQKPDFIAQAGIFSLETVLEVVMSAGMDLEHV